MDNPNMCAPLMAGPHTHHELKVWPEQFGKLESGIKTFEWRRRDRNFNINDTLALREWDPQTKNYTGRAQHRVITYVLHAGFGMPDDYCVLGLDCQNCAWNIHSLNALKERERTISKKLVEFNSAGPSSTGAVGLVERAVSELVNLGSTLNLYKCGVQQLEAVQEALKKLSKRPQSVVLSRRVLKAAGLSYLPLGKVKR